MAKKSKRVQHSFQPTTPRQAVPEVAQANPTANGPTTGYRDADEGKVERRNFNDGVIPKGWHDTPAKCENCDGKSHPEYV